MELFSGNNASVSSGSKYDISKFGSGGKSKRYTDLVNRIGLETIDADIQTAQTALNNVYGGWQDESTMAATKAQLSGLQDRLRAYEQYRQRYAPEQESASDILNSYNEILSNWDTKAKGYAKFKSAEEADKYFLDNFGFKPNYNKAVEPVPQTNFLNISAMSESEKETGKTITEKIKNAENFNAQERALINKYGLESFMPVGYEGEIFAANSDWSKKRQQNGSYQSTSFGKPQTAKEGIVAALEGNTPIPQNQADQDAYYTNEIYRIYKQTKGAYGGDMATQIAESSREMTPEQKAEMAAFLNDEEKFKNYKLTPNQKLGISIYNQTLDNGKLAIEQGNDRISTYAKTGFGQFMGGLTEPLKMGADYQPSESGAYQYASKYLADYFERTGQQGEKIFQDVVTNTASNAIPMLVGALGGGAAQTALFALSAWGNAYKEAWQLTGGNNTTNYRAFLNQQNRAVKYATAVAALEAGTETVSQLFGSSFAKDKKRLFETLINNIKNPLLKFASKSVEAGVGEFFEESIQSLLSPMIQNAFLKTKNETIFENPLGQLSQAGYDGMIGFLSGMALSSVGEAININQETNIQAKGQQYLNVLEQSGVAVESVAQYFAEISNRESSLFELSQKVLEGDTSALTVGEMLTEAERVHLDAKQKVFEAVGKSFIESNTVGAVLNEYETLANEQGFIFPDHITNLYTEIKTNYDSGNALDNVVVGEFAMSVDAYSPRALIMKEAVAEVQLTERDIDYTPSSDLEAIEFGKQQTKVTKEKNGTVLQETVPNGNTEGNTNENKPLGFTEPNEKTIRRPLAYDEQIQELSGEQKTTTIRHIEDLAKKLDPSLKVRFVPNNFGKLQGHKGAYEKSTNTMYLAKDLSTVEAYAELFKHEFVHSLERKKAYANFKNYLFDKSKAFEEYAVSRLATEGDTKNRTREEAVKDLVNLYLQKNEGMSRDVAEREAVADFVARTLFKGNTPQLRVALTESTEALQGIETDLKLFEELARDDRNLFQKIIDAIKDFIANIKGIPQFKDLEQDLAYIEERLSRVYNSADINKTATDSGTVFVSEQKINAEINEEGLAFDGESDSVFSADSWEDSAYVKDRDATAKKLADALGISKKKALQYIDDIDGIANTILADYARLGYVPSPDRSAFVCNAEYGGSIDMSTLCAKRRWLTGTFSAIQKALKHTALTANEILEIRNMLKEKGIEVSCGLCYVEGSRAQMGKFAKEFIERYKKRNPSWIPDMADVNTPEGVEKMRIEHPEAYEAYEQFWNNKGVLNEGEKNLFATQKKPKLYQLRTDYKHEILDKFSSEGNVVEKNKNGGLRIQSFSDFEIVHLIDMMQVIIDMSQVGLYGQAYTKVPEFALALGDTGLKINLSLIAKDVDANGNLIFDDVEGMPFETAMNIRKMYSKNVGTVLVVFNDAQLKAALNDSRIDFVLPFHRSQWKKAMYEQLGLPNNTKDYTYVQNERYIKPVYYTTRNGTIGKRKATNYMPNEYWDFSKSGKENAENYLKMCAENNKRPKFYKLLVDNGNGSYSLQPDGSTDGYWKLLIDFKMYDNNGKGSKQEAVKPNFNMDECYKMLDEYEGGHEKFPVDQEVVDTFVGKYMKEHGEQGFKEKTKADANAPTSKYDLVFSGDDIIASNKYWYPQMSKTDLQRVQNIAKYEVNNDKNYIDNETKWLYNDRGQKTYFAIYSTEHPENPTILYACNGNRAIRENKWLNEIVIEMEAVKDGSVDTRRKTFDEAISSLGYEVGKGGVYRRKPRPRTSLNDDGLYSESSGIRPSQALLNCIANLEQRENRGRLVYSSDDLTVTHRDLLDRYEQGEISRDEYLAEMDGLYGEAVNEYGAIEKGEYNETDMPVPKAVAENKPTERFARTFIGAAKLTPEMVETFEDNVLLGDFSYEVASDKKAIETAEQIVGNGQGEKVWENVIDENGFPSKNDIAVGEKLLTQAIANGDTYQTMKLASELADAFTRAGQVVQAARLLGKMTGAGRLVGAQRFVDSLNRDRQKKYGADIPPITIDEQLAQILATAEGKRAIEQAYGEIMKDVAAQTENTWLDKWNAWRYFAMLCNPRTHVRNIIGNGIVMPTITLKNLIAQGLEKRIDTSARTKSVFVKKEYLDYAKRDVKLSETKQALKGSKYDDKTAIKENQQTFKTKALKGATDFVFNSLEAEDMFFKNIHYVNALGGFLQARKVDLNNVSEKVLTEARAYAAKEARKATFNEVNQVAKAIQKFGEKNLLTNMLVEGILPFKRTPLNIIKMGVEYSPIGLTKSLTKGLWDLKHGKITATEFIDGVSSGISGTVTFAIGILLGSLGIAGGTGDDEDKAWYERMLGDQDYAIKFGDHSYTVDWAAPSSIPFFIGVELAETFENGFSFDAVFDSFGNAIEPIINLSALSGLQSTIESVRYADSNEILTSAITEAITGYMFQNVPTILGAFGRTIDDKQRTWYVDKNSKVPAFVQELGNNIKSKIPGLSKYMPEKVDAWGRTVSRGEIGERIFENFVSPGYYSTKVYTEVDREIEKLYDATGIKGVLPSSASKGFTVNKQTKNLTATEYVVYAKAKGQNSYDYVQEFIDSANYNKLNDEQKVAVIRSLYEYANAKAKTMVSDYDLMDNYKTVTLRERNGGSAVDYYVTQQLKK